MVLVDSVTGVPSNTNGPAEVTLDIERQAALTPGASKILVYEGPNSDAGVVDTYSRIASDNTAKEISTSWGEPENSAAAATRNSENTAFQQMAAQGQSIFAAAGDSGANLLTALSGVEASPTATTTSLTSSLNPSVAGQSVTFTASGTGTSPTGNI